jgi:hypothetical protein
LAGLAALSLPLLAGESWFAWQWLLKTAMAGFLALAGFAGGGIFALSAHLWQSQASDTAWRGGALYAVDLAGATVGALGFSLVVIPVWGLLPAFWLAAVLHLAGVALVLRPGRGEGQR